MNKEELKQIMPHRDAMLLMDEVSVGEDKKAYGQVHIRGDEWFLLGHFPGNPIVPGVILCEMAAQTCCLLIKGLINDKLPMFTGMNKVKFKHPVKPGDCVKFVGKLVKYKHPFYFTAVKGYIDDKLCLKAEYSFALVDA